MKTNLVKSLINNLGYLTLIDFSVKFVLPILAVCGVAAGALIYMSGFMDAIPFFLPYVILAFGVAFILLYPYIDFEKKKININNNMHYFITYLGSISTLQLTRTDMFKHVAAKDSFGEISKSAKKILYLAKAWNLGYAQTCRKIAQFSPSPIFADFLDRFAAILDFGQNVEIFLIDEQTAVLDDYEVMYKKSMENIRMLQEVFISMTIATGFGMSIALLLPLIMGISVEIVVRYSLIGIIIIDLFLFFLIKSIIPSDALCHTRKIKSHERIKVQKITYIFVPITLFVSGIIIALQPFPFLVNVAIGITPLIVIGYFGQKEEETIFKRDKSYPAFVRTLGSVVEIKEGAVVSSISSLRVHDFGTLNDLVIAAYRRLRLGCDKFMTWEYFSGESGSNLISQFTHIFAEAIYLGGNGEKVGALVAKNFNRLLSLRRLRIQLSSGLRGAFYGALVGFSAAAYITAKIAQTLSKMFANPFQVAQESGSVSGIFGEILPPSPEVNLSLVMLYIGIMVLVHSFVSALTIKVVDGGSVYAFFFDFVIMVWVGAVISVVIPGTIANILPENASGGTESIEQIETLGLFLLLPMNMLFTKMRSKIKKEIAQY